MITIFRKIFITFLSFFLSGLISVGCHYRREETPLTPVVTMPAVVTQILPADNGLYVLLFGATEASPLFFVTTDGAVRQVKAGKPTIPLDLVKMFAVTGRRFILLCPETNRIECRDETGDLVWAYESEYTRWRAGNLRRGHAFITARNDVVVVYTRVADITRLIWLNANNGRVARILSPLDLKGHKKLGAFGLGECKGMQLADDGRLLMAFGSTLFGIDKRAEVEVREFPSPIVGLYRDGRKVLVATMPRQEKRVIDLFAVEGNMKPRLIAKITSNKKVMLMGLDKNYFYFVDNNDIWRTGRKREIFIP